MKRSLLLFTLAATLLLGSCRKSEEPLPPATLFGDWITLGGVDYHNVVFTTHYSYIITSYGEMETGSFTMNVSKGEVTLLPEMPGAVPRTWNYVRSGDRLVVRSGAAIRVAEPVLTQDLTMVMQVAPE